MKKIKEVIRDGLPETNSSSSHSVVISKLVKSDIDKERLLSFLPNENSIINIPKEIGVYFGNRGFAASNDSLVKLQLVISLLTKKTDSIQEFGKRLFWLKRILCNFTGATDVIFEGLVTLNDVYKTYYKRNEVVSADDHDYIIYEALEYAFGNVDHQSYQTLCRDILEDKDTVLDFIFNPDSWMFLGSDSIDMDKRIEDTLRNYKQKTSSNITTYDGIVSIFFGYNLGRVDFPFYSTSNKNSKIMDIISGREGFLYALSFNPNLGIFEGITSDYSFNTKGDCEEYDTLLSFYSNNPYSIESSYISEEGFNLIILDGNYYVVFFNTKVRKLISSYFDNVSIDSWIGWGNQTYKELGMLFKKHILEPNPDLVEGIDWKLFNLKITINKYHESQIDLC